MSERNDLLVTKALGLLRADENKLYILRDSDQSALTVTVKQTYPGGRVFTDYVRDCQQYEDVSNYVFRLSANALLPMLTAPNSMTICCSSRNGFGPSKTNACRLVACVEQRELIRVLAANAGLVDNKQLIDACKRRKHKIKVLSEKPWSSETHPDFLQGEVGHITSVRGGYRISVMLDAEQSQVLLDLERQMEANELREQQIFGLKTLVKYTKRRRKLEQTLNGLATSDITLEQSEQIDELITELEEMRNNDLVARFIKATGGAE